MPPGSYRARARRAGASWSSYLPLRDRRGNIDAAKRIFRWVLTAAMVPQLPARCAKRHEPPSEEEQQNLCKCERPALVAASLSALLLGACNVGAISSPSADATASPVARASATDARPDGPIP